MAQPTVKLDKLDISTLSLHADTLDDPFASHGQRDLSVAPAVSVTTTFIRPEGSAELQDAELPPGTHIYSRYSQPVRDRTEKVLAAINQGGIINTTTLFLSI
jgi:cystathionine beta-lyase/cystathionine gamma-synthase